MAQERLSLASLPGAAAMLNLAGGRLGRAWLSWSAAHAPPYPDAADSLAAIETRLADFDTEKLESAPFGSFGSKCWALQKSNNMPPLELRRSVDSSDCARMLGARRLLLHDALHVLLGFDADSAGEIGVFSFVAAQRYSPRFDREARDLAQFYMTLAPWLRDEFQAAEYRGRELAAAAPQLLALPLEREWNTPLTRLQAQLKLRTLRTLTPMKWAPEP